MSENNLVALAPSYTKAITQVPDHYETMIAFVKAQMQKDIDYVVIPGTGSKPTLLKLGAFVEVVQRAIAELVQSLVDFEKPLFHYHYRCWLYRNGEMVGQGDDRCNSMEQKYQKKYRILT